MSTREARQDKKGTNDFGEISVEEQKRLSKERMKAQESDHTNEEIAAEEARKLDQLRANADADDFSGHL